MKVFYFNDRNQSRIVYINNLMMENRFLLKPHEAKIFEFSAPEGSLPWVKEWDNYTLISYCDEESLNGQIETLRSS